MSYTNISVRLVMSDALEEIRSVWNHDKEIVQAVDVLTNRLFEDIAKNLKFESKESSSLQEQQLRILAIETAGRAGSEWYESIGVDLVSSQFNRLYRIFNEAKTYFELFLTQENVSPVKSDLLLLASRIVCSRDVADCDRLIEAYLQTQATGSLFSKSAFRALCCSNSEAVLRKVLDHAVCDAGRGVNIPSLFQLIESNPLGRKLLWSYLKEHWDDYFFPFYSSDANDLQSLISSACCRLNTEAEMKDFAYFFASKTWPGMSDHIANALQYIYSNAAWVLRGTDGLRVWLSENVGLSSCASSSAPPQDTCEMDCL